MAIGELNFTRNWENPQDFPTFEGQEAKVRSDMQALYDEIKNYINNTLLPALVAGNLGFSSTEDIQENNVQDAIEAVQADIENAILNQVPDGSITAAKLSGDGNEQTPAVSTIKIQNDAVTADKLCGTSGSEAVTTGKIRNGAVTADKLGHYAVTSDKLDPSAVSGKADLADGIIYRRQRVFRTVNRAIDESNNYTLVQADSESIVRLNNAANATVTIPTNATAGLYVGTNVVLACTGNGTVTITPASGVELYNGENVSSNPVVVNRKNSVAVLYKADQNVWFVFVSPAQNGSIGLNQLSDAAKANFLPVNAVASLTDTQKQNVMNSLGVGVTSGMGILEHRSITIHKDDHVPCNNPGENGNTWFTLEFEEAGTWLITCSFALSESDSSALLNALTVHRAATPEQVDPPGEEQSQARGTALGGGGLCNSIVAHFFADDPVKKVTFWCRRYGGASSGVYAIAQIDIIRLSYATANPRVTLTAEQISNKAYTVS